MLLQRRFIELTAKSGCSKSFKQVTRNLTYVQGQAGGKYKREYFYAIDHQGMLFMEDARMKNFTSCFKEPKFLHFFFRRVRLNNTGLYQEEFPYVSPCGVEMNFIKCDDVPIVFTQLEGDILYHNHAGKLLSVPFEPQTLWMVQHNGRVYHKGPQKAGGVGLVASKLAIKLAKNFVFENDVPVAYIHNDQHALFDKETGAVLNSIPHYKGSDG